VNGRRDVIVYFYFFAFLSVFVLKTLPFAFGPFLYYLGVQIYEYITQCVK